MLLPTAAIASGVRSVGIGITPGCCNDLRDDCSDCCLGVLDDFPVFAIVCISCGLLCCGRCCMSTAAIHCSNRSCMGVNSCGMLFVTSINASTNAAVKPTENIA